MKRIQRGDWICPLVSRILSRCIAPSYINHFLILTLKYLLNTSRGTIVANSKALGKSPLGILKFGLEVYLLHSIIRPADLITHQKEYYPCS